MVSRVQENYRTRLCRPSFLGYRPVPVFSRYVPLYKEKKVPARFFACYCAYAILMKSFVRHDGDTECHGAGGNVPR
jgi:hypothetical protein